MSEGLLPFLLLPSSPPTGFPFQYTSFPRQKPPSPPAIPNVMASPKYVCPCWDSKYRFEPHEVSSSTYRYHKARSERQERPFSPEEWGKSSWFQCTGDQVLFRPGHTWWNAHDPNEGELFGSGWKDQSETAEDSQSEEKSQINEDGDTDLDEDEEEANENENGDEDDDLDSDDDFMEPDEIDHIGKDCRNNKRYQRRETLHHVIEDLKREYRIKKRETGKRKSSFKYAVLLLKHMYERLP